MSEFGIVSLPRGSGAALLENLTVAPSRIVAEAAAAEGHEKAQKAAQTL